MKIIYRHHVDQPLLKYVAIETATGYFNCEMPYKEFLGSSSEHEGSEIRTMTHSISQSSFDVMTSNGAWVIDQTVVYNVEAK